MNRALRVLVVAESLRHPGGVERFACQLADGLAARGFAVTLASVDTPAGSVAYPLDARVRVVAASPAALPGAIEGGRWRRLRIVAGRWRVMRSLARLAATTPHDVIVLNGLVTACCLLLGRPREAVRAVCCDHNHFDARSRPWRLLRSRIYPRVAAVVSLTEADRPRFAALQPRTRVIANASALRADQPSAAVGDTARPTVLAIGRFVRQKGLDLLIAAWPRVARAVPEARLAIVGEGPLEAELHEQAAAAAIEVDWVAATRDVEPLYRGASLFVLPSRYEGMPLALLEAQALGVPAVAFDCPTGPADIVTPATGILVAPGDVEALANAVVALLRDPVRRVAMGRAAIDRSRRDFDPGRQLDAWADAVRDAARHAATACATEAGAEVPR